MQTEPSKSFHYLPLLILSYLKSFQPQGSHKAHIRAIVLKKSIVFYFSVSFGLMRQTILSVPGRSCRLNSSLFPRLTTAFLRDNFMTGGERSMAEERDAVRLAALGDLHYTKKSHGALQDVFSQITKAADVCLLCGDSTDVGLPEEAEVLVKDLTTYLKIPIVAVLGNHDYESGRQEEVREMFLNAGMKVLDGSTCEIHGLGFAGVKGFAGGFGRVALQPWGEAAIKHFVQEAVSEAAKLEAALAGLHTEQSVVLLHYAPIRTTVVGENIEIFPFLGSSRLEEPINRYKPAAVFHGHAHGGNPEGRTGEGVPVYNASQPVLRRAFPEKPPFRLVEVRGEKRTYA